jgi:hypothetical protein
LPSNLWVQRQDIGPSPRVDHAIAEDSARSRLILFGGDRGASPPLGDTWSWDGSYWTQVADIGPSPRYGHSLGDFPPLQQLILFGGAAGGEPRGDTWAFDDTTWVQVADTGPSARSFHAVAYDTAHSVIVLFGGAGSGSVHGDTWIWDGQDWTQVQDVGPSPRSRHAMAFDSAGNRVILFGGADGSGAALGDTWAWDGSSWTQVADTGPEPRLGASITGTSPLLLFGGTGSVVANASAPPVVYNDTWKWTTQGWTKVQDMGPAPRYGHGAAIRTGAGSLALFGGASMFSSPETLPAGRTLLDDTWELPVQGGNGGTPRVVSVSVIPGWISSSQPPPPTEIATIEVTMSSPPPAGDTLDIQFLPLLPTGTLGYRAQPPPFDGQQSTIVFPLIFGGGPGILMLKGWFGVSVGYGTGGAPVIAQFEIV